MENNALIGKKAAMARLEQVTNQIFKDCESAPWVDEKSKV